MSNVMKVCSPNKARSPSASNFVRRKLATAGPNVSSTSSSVPMTQNKKTAPNLLLSEDIKQNHHDPPILLLEGDSLFVSPEGVAVSMYQLVVDDGSECHSDASASNRADAKDSAWTVEEQYHLNKAFKTFVVHPPTSTAATPTTEIGIQEIDTRVAGTGGTTWEASIAMALYFARHPEQLHGNIIELGSGVGLGGILLQQLTNPTTTQLTVTDGCPRVLNQCRANIERQSFFHHEKRFGLRDHGIASSVRVMKLDWDDALCHAPMHEKLPQPNFNVVLACDCCYRPQDVLGLTETLKTLLVKPSKQQRVESKSHNKGRSNNSISNKNNYIHLFGPYNRAAYQDVIQLLEHDNSLSVEVKCLVLKRYRLMASTRVPADNHWRSPRLSLSERLKDASPSTTKFLHVRAQWRTTEPAASAKNVLRQSLSSID